MVVKIPSLNERPGDAVLLARHFLHQYAPQMNPGVRGLAPEALQAIDAARWPGNVRELENRIKRAVIMADGRLRSEEHTSELQSLMRISYAVFCLKKKNNN